MKSRPTANPPNRFHEQVVAYDDGEAPPPAQVTLIDDHARSILAHNDSPDLGFRWSVNPYRGCQHACAYCYARPGHEYLDLGAGTDFDTKIVVKRDAPALLRAAFDKPGWQGELVMFSGVTDCYQPVERELELTRRCLEVCLEYRTRSPSSPSPSSSSATSTCSSPSPSEPGSGSASASPSATTPPRARSSPGPRLPIAASS